MPIDPVIHAHMTYLVQREKRAHEDAQKLEEDIALWKKRVGLATERGETALAKQARERALELIAKRRALQTQLDLIAGEKDILRRESRRPDGHEVDYAEELLRRWQESGLVDPDEAALDEEFDQLNAEQALAELRDGESAKDAESSEDENAPADEVIFSDPDAPAPDKAPPTTPTSKKD